ncbi:MAG: uridine kinase [Rhizobiaceae bacterium]
MQSTLDHDVAQVCDLVENCAKDTARVIIGIVGPPASGKSTLAEAVVQKLNHDIAAADDAAVAAVPARAALLPMDGYHLDNRVLAPRGLLNRKGAPETFDAEGFSKAVHELANPSHEGYYPIFDRDLDLAIANAIAISAEIPVVVVEGNYLLLRSEPWQSMRNAFTATVFVCPSMATLKDRLYQRWIDHGLEPEAAMARATQNDLPNAETVIQQSYQADLDLTQT